MDATLFIVSALSDLPDKGPTTERLLKNQSDIGNAVKPSYGDAACDRLPSLLKEHITTAAEVVSTAKIASTKRSKKDATKRWYANADEIAILFLNGANAKNWPVAEMKAMMYEYLDLTTAEVVARLKSDWAADIAAYETVHKQILVLTKKRQCGEKK